MGDASQCTPGDVIRAIEGKIAVVACLVDEENGCRFLESCPTVAFWEGMNKTINTYVDSMTLQDLADGQKTGPAADVSSSGTTIRIV